jgi:hypothetical protein
MAIKVLHIEAPPAKAGQVPKYLQPDKLSKCVTAKAEAAMVNIEWQQELPPAGTAQALCDLVSATRSDFVVLGLVCSLC